MLKAALVQGLLVANIVFANEVIKFFIIWHGTLPTADPMSHFCFYTLMKTEKLFTGEVPKVLRGRETVFSKGQVFVSNHIHV